MSTLIMIRHGQASFGSSNYDKLSHKGVEQSSVLGSYWVHQRQGLDAVFSGVQERQVHTMNAVRDVYEKADLAFPDPEIWDAFNEYDADGIMNRYLPRLMEEDPRLKRLLSRTAEKGYDSKEGRAAFQEAFSTVMERWLEEDADKDGVECWKNFKRRVLSGIRRIKEGYPSGAIVAVFTSGGPVSAVLQHVLETPDRVALDLGWIIKNGSLTEFKYKGDRFTLTGFNMTPHYNDDDLVTYR